MPVGQLTNTAGAWGSPVTASGNAFTESYTANTAVTAGQVVAFATTAGQVIPAGTAQAPQTVLGVALNSAAVGQAVQVQTQGGPVNVTKDSAVTFAQFDRVWISAATAGSVIVQAGSTGVTTAAGLGVVLGIVLTAAGAGVTTVSVHLQRW